MAVLAIFSPIIAPYSPKDTKPRDRLLPPSSSHLFGTDKYGRDILSRVIFGARISLSIGFLVAITVLVFGTFLGLISGFFSAADPIIMRVMDALMAIPSLILALALVAVWGAGFRNVVIALGITYTPRLARIARASTLRIKEEGFIEAANASGAGIYRLLFIHILPNIISPILVHITITFAFALLTEAALSFLGVGVPPQVPSWGSIIAAGRDYIVRAPWMIVFPGLAIVLTVLSVNMIGDAIRDLVDPKLRRLGG